jgi:hypothetical protein
MATAASGTLHHTCFLVHDVDGAAARLADSVGIGPWHVWTITPEEATLRGRPIAFSFRVALAEHGGTNYELIAPISGDSVYVEHLRTRGEGFHHTCHIFPTREAMRSAKAALLAQGRELIQSASLGELGEFCYIDLPETGAVLELLYLQGLPPPERAIT